MLFSYAKTASAAFALCSTLAHAASAAQASDDARRTAMEIDSSVTKLQPEMNIKEQSIPEEALTAPKQDVGLEPGEGASDSDTTSTDAGDEESDSDVEMFSPRTAVADGESNPEDSDVNISELSSAYPECGESSSSFLRVDELLAPASVQEEHQAAAQPSSSTAHSSMAFSSRPEVRAALSKYDPSEGPQAFNSFDQPGANKWLSDHTTQLIELRQVLRPDIVGKQNTILPWTLRGLTWNLMLQQQRMVFLGEDKENGDAKQIWLSPWSFPNPLDLNGKKKSKKKPARVLTTNREPNSHWEARTVSQFEKIISLMRKENLAFAFLQEVGMLRNDKYQQESLKKIMEKLHAAGYEALTTAKDTQELMIVYDPKQIVPHKNITYGEASASDTDSDPHLEGLWPQTRDGQVVGKNRAAKALFKIVTETEENNQPPPFEEQLVTLVNLHLDYEEEAYAEKIFTLQLDNQWNNIATILGGDTNHCTLCGMLQMTGKGDRATSLGKGGQVKESSQEYAKLEKDLMGYAINEPKTVELDGLVATPVEFRDVAVPPALANTLLAAGHSLPIYNADPVVSASEIDGFFFSPARWGYTRAAVRKLESEQWVVEQGGHDTWEQNKLVLEKVAADDCFSTSKLGQPWFRPDLADEFEACVAQGEVDAEGGQAFEHCFNQEWLKNNHEQFPTLAKILLTRYAPKK
ncbi:unnamed protein product [Amoebophrya sp. A120]|nr:unnamed protein product [Amoebophrya sp. A120]|eukprot:GSA120T00013003001.1